MSATVRTEGGTLAGITRDDGILHFRAVPYAAPPVGVRRFAAPVAHEGWDGVRDATERGPQSPQVPGMLDQALGAAEVPADEDCLTLEVWTPGADTAGRPVLVWIHGGSFTNGTGAVPWYGGLGFAGRSGCVLVTINYRLGALGFTHLADLTSDERVASSGVNGVLDQVAALRWVRDNIAAFGGDPGNVTIFGESAGGTSVLSVMAHPGAAGLFHKAVVQSASFRQVRDRTLASERAAQLLAHLGMTTPDVDRLMAMPVDELLAAQAAVTAELATESFTLFSPTFGTPWLPQAPLDAPPPAVPIVIGTTTDEMNLFVGFDPRHASLTREQAVARAARNAGSIEQAEALFAGYERLHPEMPVPAMASRIATHHGFTIPAQRYADRCTGPVWRYEFAFASPAFGGVLGACHALEIPFVFDSLDAPGAAVFTGDSPDRVPLAREMHDAWAGFARTGDPGWPSGAAPGRATRRFDVDSETVHDPLGPVRELWASID